MDDREFRLEVLRLTLENANARVALNPLEQAEQYLEWCLQAPDKPPAQVKQSTPRKQTGTNQK